MKHVLIVAYEFPPFADSGVYRTVKFAKYLETFGWRSTVLTVEHDADALTAPDSTLLEELPATTRILRARCIEPIGVYKRLGGRRSRGGRTVTGVAGNAAASPPRKGRLGAGIVRVLHAAYDSVVIPDARLGWYPAAMRQGAALFELDPPDLLFSTSPRETAHLIAMRLAVPRVVPWVADFRDPWMGAFFTPRKIYPYNRLNGALERRAVERSSAITVAWPGIMRDLTHRYPRLDREKCHVITNGYDADDFASVRPMPFERFTIVHIGRFLEGLLEPTLLLEGLAILFARDPTLRQKIAVSFVGPHQGFVDAAVRRHGLERNVVMTGVRVPHAQAVAYAAGAPCLYLQSMASATHGGTAPIVAPHDFIPGKLFEYLGANRPILAEVQEGTASCDILRSVRQATIVTSADSGKMADAIETLYRKERGTREHEPAVVAERYERRHLTQQLAAVFDQLVGHS